jgi:Ca2+-binding RTX toxin-like protein
MALALSVLAAPAQVAALGSVSCDYSAAQHKVTVTMTGDIGTRVERSVNGHIIVGGNWCEGKATVTNTDTIVVVGGAGAQTLNLNIDKGGFRRGFTNEPGTSDEIEVSVALAGGSTDQVVLEGSAGRDDIALGTLISQFGTFHMINLNAEEGTTDADVVMSGIEKFAVFGYGGDDRIDGEPRVGKELGNRFFDLGMVIFGGTGDDFLRGTQGNDTIYAGTGADFVAGDSGIDYVDLLDGAGMNDYSFGVVQTCVMDPGDFCSEGPAVSSTSTSTPPPTPATPVEAVPHVTAAGSVSCDYAGQTHKVTVQMTGDIGTRIKRTSDGHILVAGIWCDGKATVSNTDTIVVIGDAGTQVLNLSLALGGFKPGFTNETGTSDEIEISVSFGAGASDQVVVEGTDGDEWIHFGRINTQFGTFREINLNAGESSGLDADVFLGGVEKASVLAYGGWDNIHGDGGYGTGQDYDLPLVIFGGDGDDTMHGGTANDTFYAGNGWDQVYGSLGSDYMNMQDNLESGDHANGGPGNDTCVVDEGEFCEET